MTLCTVASVAPTLPARKPALLWPSVTAVAMPSRYTAVAVAPSSNCPIGSVARPCTLIVRWGVAVGASATATLSMFAAKKARTAAATAANVRFTRPPETASRIAPSRESIARAAGSARALGEGVGEQLAQRDRHFQALAQRRRVDELLRRMRV